MMTLSEKLLSAPPPFVVRATAALRRALLRAADAIVPAQAAVVQRVIASVGTPMLAALARAHVPELLARERLTAAELAARTHTDPDAMARTMRAAVFAGYFVRGKDGRYANNRMSRALLDSEDTARAFAIYFGSKSNLHAWADFGETLRTGKNAFERVHGMSVWEWFHEHLEELEMFAQGMMSLTLMEAASIATAYPFGELRKVCDVGGGHGTLISEILLRHPDLKGMLVDAPGVLESTRQLLGARGVLDRVELIRGSFFESVPSGADAYLLQNVLHDWDDARSQKILETCRRAMAPGQRLIVVDSLVEEDCQDHATMIDLHMMTVCSEGRERGRADFERLLRTGGFRLQRVVVTTVMRGIIEGIAV